MFWAMVALLLATILVYAVMCGVWQLLDEAGVKSAFALKVVPPGLLVEQDWKVVVYSIGATLATGVILVMAIQWLLRRLAVAPISRLNEQLVRLIREGDLTSPIAVAGGGEIQALLRAINDMRSGLDQARKDLQHNEERCRAMVEDQTELVCRFQKEGILTFVNNAYCRYFGQSRERLTGSSFIPLIPPEDQNLVKEHLATLSALRPAATFEHRVVLPSGNNSWLQWTNRVVLDEHGSIVEYHAVGRDITERKQAEEKLQASLAEKELLLEEIHHRVKNNMQIISSLLNLQADFIKDPRDVELFRESQNRIRSMALVHESLYQSDSLARVNFGNYFNQLVADLYESYSITISEVSLHIDIDPGIQLSMETAVPCGLIVNELISNALKHAFPASVLEQRRGEIRVFLKPDGDDHLMLVVADTGGGLPPDFNIKQLKTLGLKLVTTLTAQIQGTVTYESRGGTICRVRFPTYTI